MFDSLGIISQKGILGSVWIAAHCLQKLKKKDVMETDIVTCVDTILHGEANHLRYQILAYLLLGVVRIYSKKVEFLQYDFADVLREAKNFKATKEIRRTKFYNSITIPKSFELDTFNLDISEDQDVCRVHVASREDITLADDSRGDIFCKNDKYHGHECTFSYEAFSLTNTPVRDVCSPWFMGIDSEIGSSDHKCILKSRIENLVGTRISLEKCLDKEMLDDIEKNPGFDMSSDVRCQTDGQEIMHHDVGILLEKSTNSKSVQPITLDDAEKDSSLDIVLDEGETDGEQMNCLDAETNYQEPATMEESVVDIEKNSDFDMSSDVGCRSDGQKIMHHDVGILLEKSTNNKSGQPIILDDAGKDFAFDMVQDEGETDREHINCPDAETSYRGPETMEKSVSNEQSVEKLCEFGFSAVDHLKLVVTDEIDNDAHSAMSSGEGHQMLAEHLRHPDKSINFESEENRLLSKTFLRNQIQRGSPLSVSVSVTPSSKITSCSGSAELIAIDTPASKQRSRVLGKRKSLLDDKLIISNRVLRDQINDSSDLVRKRVCAPVTALQAWRVQKRCNPSKTLSESVIPCTGINFSALVSERKLKTILCDKTPEIPLNPVILDPPTHISAASDEASVNPVVGVSTTEKRSVEVSAAPLDPIHLESPVAQTPLETAEAPDTPVLVESSAAHRSHLLTPTTPTPFSQFTTLRLREAPVVPEPDVLESVNSSNNIEKQKTLNEDQESDIGGIHEGPTSPLSDNAEKCEWSAETWKAASYLHQNISNLKQQENIEFFNLSQSLEKENKTVCAKLFYEILALKTGDYINVRQEDAYGDILVQEKPKLKKTLDAHGRKFHQT